MKNSTVEKSSAALILTTSMRTVRKMKTRHQNRGRNYRALKSTAAAMKAVIVMMKVLLRKGMKNKWIRNWIKIKLFMKILNKF